MDSLHFWCTGFLKPEWNHQSGGDLRLYLSLHIFHVYLVYRECLLSYTYWVHWIAHVPVSSTSILSTRIACFVCGCRDSELPHPLSRAIYITWILPVSRKLLVSLPSSIYSPYFSYFAEQDWIILTQQRHMTGFTTPSWWHAASALQSCRGIEKWSRVSRGPRSPKRGSLWYASEPRFTKHLFHLGSTEQELCENYLY